MTAPNISPDRHLLPRVLHDSNDGSEGHGYKLKFDQSKLDLAAIPGGPREGLRVLLYMVGEYEIEAVLRRGKHDWLGFPIAGTNIQIGANVEEDIAP